jgi:hypothetical protein
MGGDWAVSRSRRAERADDQAGKARFAFDGRRVVPEPMRQRPANDKSRQSDDGHEAHDFPDVVRG